MTQKNSFKKEDLRVRRTRKQLLEAMIALSIQKGFNSVTVQEISEVAMVNRATFYRYYQDKYDLLDQYLQDQYNLQFPSDEADAHTNQQESSPDAPPRGLVRMWEHVQENGAFLRVMLGPKGDPTFTQKLRVYIEKRVRSSRPDLAEGADPLPLDLILSYISSASIGLILWWLENDMPYSPTEMAVWSIQLSTADLVAALGPAALHKNG